MRGRGPADVFRNGRRAHIARVAAHAVEPVGRCLGTVFVIELGEGGAYLGGTRHNEVHHAGGDAIGARWRIFLAPVRNTCGSDALDDRLKIEAIGRGQLELEDAFGVGKVARRGERVLVGEHLGRMRCGWAGGAHALEHGVIGPRLIFGGQEPVRYGIAHERFDVLSERGGLCGSLFACNGLSIVYSHAYAAPSGTMR